MSEDNLKFQREFIQQQVDFSLMHDVGIEFPPKRTEILAKWIHEMQRDNVSLTARIAELEAKIARLVEVGDAIDQELLEFGARGYGKTELRTAWLRAKEGKE